TFPAARSILPSVHAYGGDMARGTAIPVTLFFGVFITVAAGMTRGNPAQKAASTTNTKLTKIYFGVEACRECHGMDKALAEKIVSPEKALFRVGTEMAVWDQHDKHKDATKVLDGPRGRQMAKLLDYPVAQDNRCLNCHGVVIEKGADCDPDSFCKTEQQV